jgi:hypothetical protein
MEYSARPTAVCDEGVDEGVDERVDEGIDEWVTGPEKWWDGSFKV